MKFNLRLLYLYLFSFVGLLITVIGSVQITDLAIKTYIFKVSDYTYYAEPMMVPDGKQIATVSAELQKKRNEEEQANQRKRQLSTSLSLILVGIPLYLYHWTTIKKENQAPSA